MFAKSWLGSPTDLGVGVLVAITSDSELRARIYERYLH